MKHGFEPMNETTQGAVSADPVLDLDVVMIGGGISGCYAAWRLRWLDKRELAPSSLLLPLLERKDQLDVGLFEDFRRSRRPTVARGLDADLDADGVEADTIADFRSAFTNALANAKTSRKPPVAVFNPRPF
jgi:flavin-dependent dehydrogenase